MDYHKCTKCGKEYPLKKEYFYRRNNRTKGFVSQCKKCSNKRGENAREKYRSNNKEQIKEINKNYRETHKEQTKEYSEKYRKQNKEKIKEMNKLFSRTEKSKIYQGKYYKENKDKILAYSKEYRAKNKDKINSYFQNKRHNDLHYRIYKNMQSRIQRAVKLDRTKKADSTEKLIGCSIDCFKKHLESKFQGSMMWDNYGSDWHVDHIKPCASFDLSIISEQRKCFNYTNTQPLWAGDNLSKNSRYNGKLIRRGSK